MDTDFSFILSDNQDITRMGLRSYLNEQFDRPQISNATDKEALVAALLKSPKSIVILDYTLFNLNNYEELLNIAKRFPTTQWLLFSSDLSEQFIHRMSQEKNFSMVLKDAAGIEIISALQCVSQNSRYFCQQVTNLLVMGPSKPEIQTKLTSTEIEILKLIAHGKTVKEIAAERYSSIHTITTHKKNIFRKLEVNNVYEATKYALRAGLVEMADYYI